MTKCICVFFLIFLAKQSFCQEVIIQGKNNNRPLTWNDFTGRPDNGSSHDAYTYWNVNYGFKSFSFKGDTVKLTGISVKLTLDEKLSWIKDGKQTTNLLKHEQGHFNIGLLCQTEMIKQFNSTIFFKADYQNKIQALFTGLLEKYRLLGVQYDEETDHSKNQESQDKWNVFFAKALNK